jgi:hypothetical protein
MATVSLSRALQADPETVESALTDDVEALMESAGFDSVTVEDDIVSIERRLGLATLSLSLRQMDGADAALTFEQTEGVFEEMSMTYSVEPTTEGCELRGRTTFTLGGVAGSVLDETLVRRQRTGELEDQFDYIEQTVTE